jgi:hypothetical protein
MESGMNLHDYGGFVKGAAHINMDSYAKSYSQALAREFVPV